MNPIRNINNDKGYTSILKTIGIIGDSLSSGELEETENGIVKYYDHYDHSWGSYLSKKNNLKVFHFSKGGLRVDTFFKSKDIYNSCFNEVNKCNAYYIALGYNDINHFDTVYNNEIGDTSKIKKYIKNDEYVSFFSYYIKLIKELREFNPNAFIFLVSLPKEYNPTINRKKYSKTFSIFLNKIPKYFKNIFVIDLYKYHKTYDKEFHDKYFKGGHMNFSGYEYTSIIISKYTDYIIRKNYIKFKDIK